MTCDKEFDFISACTLNFYMLLPSLPLSPLYSSHWAHTVSRDICPVLIYTGYSCCGSLAIPFPLLVFRWELWPLDWPSGHSSMSPGPPSAPQRPHWSVLRPAEMWSSTKPCALRCSRCTHRSIISRKLSEFRTGRPLGIQASCSSEWGNWDPKN